MDPAPHQVHAALLDESIYVCSPRTMSRLLEQHGEVRERRDQLRHPTYQRPELVAPRANAALPRSSSRGAWTGRTSPPANSISTLTTGRR